MPRKGGTAHSISFATGAEAFSHTDFVLDAPLPIDIISKQGETIVAHVGIQIDVDSGCIRALWEIKEGKLVLHRPHLARYEPRL